MSEPQYIQFRTTWASRWLGLLVEVLDQLGAPAKYTAQVYALGHQWSIPSFPHRREWFTGHALANLLDLFLWDLSGPKEEGCARFHESIMSAD